MQLPVPANVVVGPVGVTIPNQTWTISAQLCTPAGATTVQLLQSGATYGRQYWDFGYDPGTYSYVRNANAAGFATLNVDRLGVGESSHPLPELITTATEASIAHLLVSALRSGRLGVAFSRVALVGHSYGSVVALAEAGTYRDVDSLVLTGLDHELGLPFVTSFTASLVPAALDDPRRFGSLPLGYLTTRAGTRAQFYYEPDADPAVIAHDEATKQTVTDMEDASFPASLPDTLGITAPVDVVVGQHDALVCGVVEDCTNPLSLVDLEHTFYPAAASFTMTVIRDAGHDLNLQRNAPQTFRMINTWIATH